MLVQNRVLGWVAGGLPLPWQGHLERIDNGGIAKREGSRFLPRSPGFKSSHFQFDPTIKILSVVFQE